MKRLVRFLVFSIVILVLVALAGVGYLFARYPDVPPAEAFTIERTPERLARGKYLVDHVALCLDCHSTRDMSLYAGPIVPGTEGVGGEFFGDEAAGLKVYSRNITPAAIGTWTDGELVRAITAGVRPDGSALFPIMPYPHYATTDRSDIEAIVAYIRTLKPLTSDVPDRELPFPLPFVVRTMPAAARFESRPPSTERWAYGKYMVKMASCTDCHTPVDAQGQALPGREFAGGREFPLPGGGVIRTANITPDMETGIGRWREEEFVQKFKGFARAAPRRLSAAEQRQNTIMPWAAYSGMTEDDLRAMYNYLRFLPPVRNKVATFD